MPTPFPIIGQSLYWKCEEDSLADIPLSRCYLPPLSKPQRLHSCRMGSLGLFVIQAECRPSTLPKLHWHHDIGDLRDDIP